MTRSPATRPLFWPLVPLYRVALAVQEQRYRPGSKSIKRLDWPVVSVGNLSAGGSGKTPLVIALAQALASRGIAVDVLSRGYQRTSKDVARVDPNGTVAAYGDEPILIARTTGAPVYVGAERYEAGKFAEAKLRGAESEYHPSDNVARVGHPQPVGLHLLDDGFQHRQLHRDIDILLLSRNDLSDHLLPAGNLREPPSAINRADVIAIPEDEPDVAEQIKAWGFQGQVWRLRRRMEIPRLNGPAVAFCGIARPGQFFEGLEAAGAEIATRVAFPDHYRYSADDMERIVFVAREARASALLTTEKDYVRMAPLAQMAPSHIPIHTVALRTEIENENAATEWLMQRVTAIVQQTETSPGRH